MQRSSRPDLLFVLSVDTEEEWDWSGDFPQRDFSVKNTVKIPEFQQFCQELSIRPTYFVDYAVAEDAESIERLKPVVDSRQCEIGAHLHPWCNPPFYGSTGEKESHVVNLPVEQVEQKLDELMAVLKNQFNVMPNAFRTGRWGIDGKVLELLGKKGFGIDSSIYPFFKNEYFDCERSYLRPYWPDYQDPMRKSSQRNIMEFPVTVGFNHANYNTMLKLYNWSRKPVFERLHLVGILWHTRIMRKLYFSPEVTTGKDMQPLVDFAINNHHPVLHMYLHSSSLIDGATGFMPGKNTLSQICKNISQVVEYAKTRSNLKFCTISEAATILQNRSGSAGAGMV